MGPLLLGVDLGTSATKAALVGPDGIAGPVVELPTPLPTAKGELDAEAALEVGLEAMAAAAAGADPARVAGIAITGQRATVVPVGEDGRAAAPARSWQSPGGWPEVLRALAPMGEAQFRTLTGLIPHGVYSLAGIVARGWRHRARWRFASLPDLALARLGASDLWTDPSLAAATWLSRLDGTGWCEEILVALDLDPARLPRQAPGGHQVGELAAEVAGTVGLATGTPLLLPGGDQQCAVAGAGPLGPATAVLSTGTSAAVVVVTDALPSPPPEGVLAMAHAVPGQWVLEGFIPAFGSKALWMVTRLGLADVGELEAMAEAGDPGARGYYQALVEEVVGVFAALGAHRRVRHLHQVGGASGSAFLARCLAESTGCRVSRAAVPHATLIGAARVARAGLPS